MLKRDLIKILVELQKGELVGMDLIQVPSSEVGEGGERGELGPVLAKFLLRYSHLFCYIHASFLN